MKVINGKWQDQYGEPVDHFNAPKLMEIGQKVKAVYGDDITSNRIDLISRLNHIRKRREWFKLSIKQ
jgi:hypothetical protein